MPKEAARSRRARIYRNCRRQRQFGKVVNEQFQYHGQLCRQTDGASEDCDGCGDPAADVEPLTLPL